jgi:hypothetical protein
LVSRPSSAGILVIPLLWRSNAVRQRLSLVHFSGQPEPSWTQNTHARLCERLRIQLVMLRSGLEHPCYPLNTS